VQDQIKVCTKWRKYLKGLKGGVAFRDRRSLSENCEGRRVNFLLQIHSSVPVVLIAEILNGDISVLSSIEKDRGRG